MTPLNRLIQSFHLSIWTPSGYGHSLRTSIPTVPHAHISVDDGPFSVAISAVPAGRNGFRSPADPPHAWARPPHDRRRPSEGMDGGVEAAGMGDDRRRGKITLERPQGVLM